MWDKGDEISSLDQYLTEISRHQLITPEEERRLAPLIRAGDEESLQKLARSNLRFVVSVAKKYQNRGIPLSDLIQEGNVGLMIAAKKFDEREGVKFISYGVWWIRQSILSALAEQGGEVRVPLNAASYSASFNKKLQLKQLQGTDEITAIEEVLEEDALEEQAKALKDNLEAKVADVETIKKRKRELLQLVKNARKPLYLDEPVGENSDYTIGDTLPYESEATDALAEQSVRSRYLDTLLGRLERRDEKVLRLYFGYHREDEPQLDPMTLEEVGGVLGVTRERIRQLRDRALKRVKEQARIMPQESRLQQEMGYLRRQAAEERSSERYQPPKPRRKTG